MMEDARGNTDTVRSGGKVQFITQRKRKDGSLVDVEVFGIPVILGGKQVGSLGLYHDVSDLVRYQKIAQAAEEQVPIEVSEPQESIPSVEEEQQMPEIEVKSPKEVAPSRARLILVEKIEGIGPVYAQKLLEVGVKTTADLLEQGKSRKGREELVEKTGISAALMLKWVNMADMMRISGIGEEYSELLEKAGVDTVKELRNRIPENLHQALGEANKVHKLVRRLPHLSEVEKWVKEAKEAETLMTY
jgi:predicted flap endonuclease-1-like 5' DNA nuclease